MTNFYPFGMEMQDRSANSGTTRFGYNGKIKDNDIKGEGNSYNFDARIYDPRVGRWLSLDPLRQIFPSLSPFHYSNLNPILYIDLGGLAGIPYIYKFEYDDNPILNVVRAVDNTAINFINSGISVVNSSISTYETIRDYGINGCVNKIGNEFNSIYKSTISDVKQGYDYLTTTSFKQQVSDIGNGLAQADNIENGLTFVVSVYGPVKYLSEKPLKISNTMTETEQPTLITTNDTKGWKVGDPINNMTSKGKQPTWNGVKQRYWKNEAYYNSNLYTPGNVSRMKKGLSEQYVDYLTGKNLSYQLHHNPLQSQGNLYYFKKVTIDEHKYLHQK